MSTADLCREITMWFESVWMEFRFLTAVYVGACTSITTAASMYVFSECSSDALNYKFSFKQSHTFPFVLWLSSDCQLSHTFYPHFESIQRPPRYSSTSKTHIMSPSSVNLIINPFLNHHRLLVYNSRTDLHQCVRKQRSEKHQWSQRQIFKV